MTSKSKDEIGTTSELESRPNQNEDQPEKSPVKPFDTEEVHQPESETKVDNPKAQTRTKRSSSLRRYIIYSCIGALLGYLLLGSRQTKQDPFLAACSKGDLDEVRSYVAESETPLKPNSTSDCLFIAAAYGHNNVVEELLDRGADPNPFYCSSSVGCSPLFVTLTEKRFSTAELLLKGSADADIVHPKFLVSPLDYLCMDSSSAEHDSFIALLLRYGAKPDVAKDTWSSKATPLLWAVSEGRLEAVRMLVDAGADVGFTLKDGSSLADYAKYKGFKEVEEYLVGRGVKSGTPS